MIPKVIYQTFYTKNLPQNISNLIEGMKILNPEYEFHLYDDKEIESFIESEFGGNVYKAFKMLKVGAAKADLWRYCVLYKNGGIYLDIDSEINNNLDLLITKDYSAIISRETHKDIFLQWCLMFESNHSILKMCIDKCVENILNKKSDNILHLTGPVVFSKSVFEYCKELNINIWTTSDKEVNKYITVNKLDLMIYSTDFGDFCKFKNNFHSDIESFNITNNRYRHWSDEKKIFN
jgi:mannosyltransferase OCH1-like enzyme